MKRSQRKLTIFFLFLFAGITASHAQETGESVILTVMPFLSVGDSVALNLGDSFSETLTTKLVGLRGLKVYERAQFQKVIQELAMQRDSTGIFDQASIVKAGSIISMDYMIVGSVTLAGNKLACQLRMVRVRDGRAILSQQFNGTYPGDIFGLQDTLALQVVDSLKLNMNDLDKRRLFRQPTKSLDSWSLYNKSLGNLPAQERIVLLEKALEVDPAFIQAAHLLTDLYLEIEKPDSAMRTYAKILALDSGDFRALYNSALLSYDQGDLAKARSLMQKCLAQKEGDPDIFFHLGLFCEFDDSGNRFASSVAVSDAYAWYKKALERDPLHRESLEGFGMLGLIMAQSSTDPAGQLAFLEASRQALGKFTELSPDSPEIIEIQGALEQIKSLIPQIQEYLNKK